MPTSSDTQTFVSDHIAPKLLTCRADYRISIHISGSEEEGYRRAALYHADAPSRRFPMAQAFFHRAPKPPDVPRSFFPTRYERGELPCNIMFKSAGTACDAEETMQE